MGASMIRDLTAAIIRDGKVPSDWEQFHCLPLQGKGGCIGRGNYRSQADRAGYKNLGEDCGRPHQTVGQSRIPSLASSQAEALQMQSLLSGSCKKSI